MKKILIIEDEKELAGLLAGKLKEKNFSVAIAVNGREGLDKIAQEKPDLILLDLAMPVLDGIAVLKELKSSVQTRDILVIVLTNLISDQRVAEVLEAGGTRYLVKADHNTEDIVAEIKKNLGMTEE